MVNKVYVGDIGTAIILETGEDISTASAHNIAVERPDGTETVWRGSIYENTKILYTTKEGDLSMAGRWRFMPDGAIGNWDGYGNTVTLIVYSKFH